MALWFLLLELVYYAFLKITSELSVVIEIFKRVLRSSAFEHYHLSTIETLLGSASRADNVIVLGLLTQCSADSYQVEDLTGEAIYLLEGFKSELILFNE